MVHFGILPVATQRHCAPTKEEAMFTRFRAMANRQRPAVALVAVSLLIGLTPLIFTVCQNSSEPQSTDDVLLAASVKHGQNIFRYDTFGDEEFWTGTLKLNEAIQDKVDPITALGVGLKVDSDALPPGILDTADLEDPATTVALIKLNAVVGVQGTVDKDNNLVEVGITCALCHSTVDDSVQPGIGKRLDGWANRDLDVGAIVALSDEVEEPARSVYEGWEPGFYDPRFNIDGLNTPIVIPPVFGLQGIDNETYTADGPISYWNAYVAVTQMHGQGTFVDERLGISVINKPDRVTPKLKALLAYQLSLETPSPPADFFDEDMADDGRDVFEEHCQSCHVNVTGTDNNAGVLHDADETDMDGAYAERTVNKAYRTTPLRGLFSHAPYFHDGSAETIEDVVDHYIGALGITLSTDERANLIEFVKSL
jgi:cytochrome c5